MAFLIIYLRNVCHSQIKKCLPPVWIVFESKPNRIRIAYAFIHKYESYCYCYSYYDFFISIKGTYNYTLETNRVSVVYNVTVILRLQHVILVMLFPMMKVLYVYFSTFRNICAVPSMVVLCTSFVSCFPGMLFTYFINDFGMVAVVPIINAIISVFKFHITCILKSLRLL